MKDEDARPKFEILPPEKDGRSVTNADASKGHLRPFPTINLHVGLSDTIKEVNNLITDHRVMAWFVLTTTALIALMLAFAKAASTPVGLQWFTMLAIASG
ncbi:MAG: hypothetical protein ACOYKM_11765 [Caulobacterales bacterium]|jgi:hypothetical protein